MATIKGYGKAELAEYYDLYDVAYVDAERDYVYREEHYLTEGDFNDALQGREVAERQIVFGYVDVVDEWGETHECECTHFLAYVIGEE